MCFYLFSIKMLGALIEVHQVQYVYPLIFHSGFYPVYIIHSNFHAIYVHSYIHNNITSCRNIANGCVGGQLCSVQPGSKDGDV